MTLPTDRPSASDFDFFIGSWRVAHRRLKERLVRRGKGVAVAALSGALQEFARLGGGTVESRPEDAAGRTVFSSYL